MNFTQFVSAMFGPLKRLTDFSGRSTRAEFWPFMFLLYAAQQIVTWIAINPFMREVQQLTDPLNPRPPEEVGAQAIAMMTANVRPFSMLVAALAAGAMAMAAAVVVRRLHDTNRSGVHALPLVLCQIVTMTLVWMIADELLTAGEWLWPEMLVPLLIASGIGFALNIYLIILCALDGTIGPNRFGEDPKGRTEEGEAALRAERAARMANPPAPASTVRSDKSAPSPARIVNGD